MGGNDTIVLDATIELDSDTDLEDSTRVVEETDEAEAGKAEETKAEAAGEGEEGEAMETEIVTSTPPRRNFNTVAKTETGINCIHNTHTVYTTKHLIGSRLHNTNEELSESKFQH